MPGDTDSGPVSGADAATEDDDGPSDEAVVTAASEAAEGLVLSRFKQSNVRDLDVTVTFEDGVLEVDVYVNAPDGDGDTEQVADDAALAARDAVDELFADGA